MNHPWLSTTGSSPLTSMWGVQAHSAIPLISAETEPRPRLLRSLRSGEAPARIDGGDTPIQPVQMDYELLHRVSGIDGSILLDPKGICFAIGVILDGSATSDCSPVCPALRRKSDGRPFSDRCLDDKTVDLISLLSPQMRRSEIEDQIVKLEKASTHDYHSGQS